MCDKHPVHINLLEFITLIMSLNIIMNYDIPLREEFSSLILLPAS